MSETGDGRVIRSSTAALAALLLASAAGPALAQGSPSAAAARSVVNGPLVDHHQHLLSPTAAQRLAPPAFEAVQLPPELAAVLSERARVWNDPAALERLYTEDAMLRQERNPSWMRGRKAVADNVAALFARAHRITPLSFGATGDAAHIEGFMSRDLEDGGVRHFGFVHLSLRRGADGAWRIAAESLGFPGPSAEPPIDAEQLIRHIDAAGIRRAVVLSLAYWYGSPLDAPVPDEIQAVRAENDWTIQQAARYPDRLVAFCSFNPLKDYAVAELERCAARGVRGVKLHFGNSGVDLKKPEHVEAVRTVFRAANRRRLAIVAHLWTLDKDYGRKEAEVFLSELLPAAPDVVVQIAHFAGGGPGYTDEALAVYADAVAAGDPRTRNLYFDIATVATDQSDEVLARFAERIRQIGVERILYGSDAAFGGRNTPRKEWGAFRGMTPLTDSEFAAIADNVAPYLR